MPIAEAKELVMPELIFWFSGIFIFYTYIGYPLSLWFIRSFASREVVKIETTEWPSVTVVIAAKNEERNIGKRIENIQSQKYSGPPIEIIVVSDGSTDDTDNILRILKSDEQKLAGVELKVLTQPHSLGKPAALNKAIGAAGGEIVVFADARQTFSEDAIQQLVGSFTDSLVGGVSGELLFYQDDQNSLLVEMGTYWRYEKFVRQLESASGSVMGATGAIYAIRRRLYRPIRPETLLDDVLIPLNVISQNYRVVFENKARAYDVVSEQVAGEWKRKVRTLAGNWQLVGSLGVLDQATRYHFLYRFFWHKFARLLVPFFLVFLLASSLLTNAVGYRLVFWLQMLCYLCVFLTHYVGFLKKITFLKVLYFFFVLNGAAVMGFWVWLSGGCKRIWKS
ncbi:MAG: glycosyltransferase family 2 protein [Desulfopila sp.]